MTIELQPTLEKIGLSPKQAKVYLALLELGEAGMTEISHAANLKRPTTYLIIEELELLGLVSEIKKEKRKIYCAAHPRRLSEITRFRMHQIEEAYPELVARYGSDSTKPKVEMYEGMEGVRKAYREVFNLLSEKKECLWISDISMVLEKAPEVLGEYNKLVRSIRDPHIRELSFGGPASKEWSEKTQKMARKNHHIKYLGEKGVIGEIDQCIIGNKVISFSLGKNIFVLITESEAIAETQRGLFELILQRV